MSNVKLGKASLAKLDTIKPELRAVCLKAFETMPFDITVIEGVRTLERQKQLLAQGATKTLNSKHLVREAVDMAPYPVDWKNLDRFRTMRDHMFEAAKELGTKIRWGGDWNRNGDSKDEKFYDGPHFELDN